MTDCHSPWVRTPEQSEDPERIAIREALAFGRAAYERRRAWASASLIWPGPRT